MTHEYLPPTYALVRPRAVGADLPGLPPRPDCLPSPGPAPVPDPEALQRAVAHVGSDFPAVGAWLVEGWVAS